VLEQTAMNDESMSLEESFHNCFFYFQEALHVLALDASAQCEVMENYNVAREIQQDVRDGGTALVNSPADYLSQEEKDAIAKLLKPLNDLPASALLRHEHRQAMDHPAWAELRVLATHLIGQLDDAANRNRVFFNRQSSRQ
jgi:hypothetical protein